MFVIVEGIDGSGKTTLVLKLVQWLRQVHNVNALATFDPGTTPTGDAIRELIYKREAATSSLGKLLLHLGARAELNSQVINPALLKGQWVIADRHWPSTVAYNWIASGLSVETARTIITTVDKVTLTSDARSVVLYLDVSIEQSLERLQRRGEVVPEPGTEARERLEQRLAWVRLGYETAKRWHAARWVTLDANQDSVAVLEQAKSVCLRLLHGR